MQVSEPAHPPTWLWARSAACRSLRAIAAGAGDTRCPAWLAGACRAWSACPCTNYTPPLPHPTDGEPAAAKKPRVAAPAKLPSAVVLDIEGTVARYVGPPPARPSSAHERPRAHPCGPLPAPRGRSISYITDVLFPYARERLHTHLEATFDSPETRQDVELLRAQAQADAAAGAAVVSIPEPGAGREAVIAACVANCQAQMAADRKTTALKALQGHIWHSGFASGALKAELFRDVPDALAEWRRMGLKTYIYSSGSREAQRDLFGHTTVGDLRPYLCGFFDTASGPKVRSGGARGGRCGWMVQRRRRHPTPPAAHAPRSRPPATATLRSRWAWTALLTSFLRPTTSWKHARRGARRCAHAARLQPLRRASARSPPPASTHVMERELTLPTLSRDALANVFACLSPRDLLACSLACSSLAAALQVRTRQAAQPALRVDRSGSGGDPLSQASSTTTTTPRPPTRPPCAPGRTGALCNVPQVLCGHRRAAVAGGSSCHLPSVVRLAAFRARADGRGRALARDGGWTSGGARGLLLDAGMGRGGGGGVHPRTHTHSPAQAGAAAPRARIHTPTHTHLAPPWHAEQHPGRAHHGGG